MFPKFLGIVSFGSGGFKGIVSRGRAYQKVNLNDTSKLVYFFTLKYLKKTNLGGVASSINYTDRNQH
jgi:hypothetical protein